MCVCIFQFLGYSIIMDESLIYPFEVYCNGNIVGSFSDFNSAMDVLPFAEYF